MKIIDPILITDSEVTTTNIVDTTPVWSGATPYVLDDLVQYNFLLYTALQSTTGDTPSDDDQDNPVYWLLVGAYNPLKPFDSIVSNGITNTTGTIEYTITVTDFSSGIAFFNMVNIVELYVKQTAEATIVYEQTIVLPPGATAASLSNLPLYKATTIEIELRPTKESTSTSVGEIVIGELKELGYSEYGPSVGIVDYSVKETDSFGNFTILERAFSKKADVNVKMAPGALNALFKTLSNLRSVPIAWIISENEDLSGILILYGFYKDFSVAIPNVLDADLNISIEGLV